MPCFKPLHGYRSKDRNPTGKRSIVFNLAEGFRDLKVQLPCGQCNGCRLERSRQWAIRCVHEASLHEQNCFLTLTYDEHHLPEDGSLQVEHFQKFMKRLRKRFPNRRIRFFHCGEYGDLFGRPHYHAILFGFDFVDKIAADKSKAGEILYASPTLTEIWGHGRAMIGDVTFESCAYVARYIMKKLTGPRAEEYAEKKPEYTTMSRRPGIGREWVVKWKSDVYPDDFIVINGKKMRPPKAYDQYLESLSSRELLAMKGKRKTQGERHAVNNTWDRLKVRERLTKERLKQLKRGYENED